MFNIKNNLERRKSARLPHISQIEVKESTRGVFSKGRMFNYSEDGLFFETNIFLNRGTEVLIAIDDSPFCNSTTGDNLYFAIIRYCRELDDSRFRYGCGAELVESFGSAADNSERRRDARIPICVPISCVSVDSKSMPLDHNMGVIKDVSKSGVGIEANKDVNSDRLILTLVDLNDKITEMMGKVVFSKKNASGTFKIGVLLQGKQLDIIEFVKKLVRFHHYTKKQNID